MSLQESKSAVKAFSEKETIKYAKSLMEKGRAVLSHVPEVKVILEMQERVLEESKSRDEQTNAFLETVLSSSAFNNCRFDLGDYHYSVDGIREDSLNFSLHRSRKDSHEMATVLLAASSSGSKIKHRFIGAGGIDKTESGNQAAVNSIIKVFEQIGKDAALKKTSKKS